MTAREILHAMDRELQRSIEETKGELTKLEARKKELDDHMSVVRGALVALEDLAGKWEPSIKQQLKYEDKLS